jgi:thiamine-phosphate pyrophosphorylase
VIDPRLYLVFDPVHGRARPGALLAAAVAGGVTAVQVRSPTATTRELHAATLDVRGALTGTGVGLVVDDRLDVALAAGADGVHLGQDDLPVPAARRVADTVAYGFSIGWSVGRPEDVEAARALAPGVVDLLGAGPVWTTATKPDAGEGIGPEALAALVARAPVPVVAIGGVTPERAEAALDTGVAGLAVSSAITEAADPAAAARTLRRAVDARRAAHSWRARG